GAIDFWVHVWAQAAHGPGTHPHYGPRRRCFQPARSCGGSAIGLTGKREKLTLGKYPALTLKKARPKSDEARLRIGRKRHTCRRTDQAQLAGQFRAWSRSQRVGDIERTR